jgi:formiminotetrahydrofolate cyclodeaminase
LSHLLENIASGAPAPASGSAAAAVVAASAALVQKVARLSEKQLPEEANTFFERAERLRLEAEELVEHDTHAYLDYIAARRSGEGVREAAARTIEVPLEICRCAGAVVEMAVDLSSRGNPNLREDAVVAVILGEAAARSAARLVSANLGAASRDRRRIEAGRIVRATRVRATGLAGAPRRGRARSEGNG